MDVYLLSRNILALKRPGAATRIGSIPLPLFSKRNEPLHSPQTTFFRDLAGLHQTSDANGVGLANAQRNVCALHQNATRHGIPIVVSPAAVHVSNRSASTYRIVRLPRIGSFGFHVSDRSAQHNRRQPAPVKCGPASTPVRNASEFDAQCRRRGGRNQRHQGNKDPYSALFASPPSSDRCDPSPEALPPRPIFRHPILWKAPHTTQPTLHQSSQRQDQP